MGFIYDMLNDDNRDKFSNSKFFKPFNRISFSLNVFNLMDVKNVISYQWLQDISGNYYAIPNRLTGRRINLKLVATF